MSKEILSDKELSLLTALVQLIPTIGRWIIGLADGNDASPTATRRVRDVLAEKSASQAVADALRGR